MVKGIIKERIWRWTQRGEYIIYYMIMDDRERERRARETKIENRISDDSVGLKIFGYELSTRDGEEDEYLNGREKRCSRIAPLMQIFIDSTSDGKLMSVCGRGCFAHLVGCC